MSDEAATAVDVLGIRDMIECPVCTEVYSDPRMLPCQHTFCCSCLSDVARGADCIVCPLCRQTFALADGCASLPSNIYVTTITDAMSARDTQSAARDCRIKLAGLERRAREQLATDQLRADSLQRVRELLGGFADSVSAQIARRAAELHGEVDRVKDELTRVVAERRDDLAARYEDCNRRLADKIIGVRDVEHACKMLRKYSTDADVTQLTESQATRTESLINRIVTFPEIVGFRFDPGPPVDRVISGDDDVIKRRFGTVTVVRHPEPSHCDRATQPSSTSPVDDHLPASKDPECGPVCDEQPVHTDDAVPAADATPSNDERGSADGAEAPDASDTNRVLLVYGLNYLRSAGNSRLEDVDLFVSCCEEHVGFRPRVLRNQCRRLSGGRSLIVALEDELEARKLTDVRRIKADLMHIEFLPYTPR